tara:strand:+ start:301 stop:1872 length:1572 start_codon:yes stop_codon:yes gene_type:complete
MQKHPPVCILTSGKGSRMESITNSLNKALVPVNNKAAISHIIDKFPSETEFIIGIGYLGSQVKDYLNIAHPENVFRFVKIDNYDGEKSGPGYSLLCCKDFLDEPFVFVSCDTLWEDDIVNDFKDNWMAVSDVPVNESNEYCNLKIRNGYVEGIKDKVLVEDESYKAFCGLCFIKDYEVFWNGLAKDELISGEHQISNGIMSLIDNCKVMSRKIVWTDIGNIEKYKNVIKKYDNFDFSKVNETIYILNNKVIKFFADENIIKRRIEKSKLNQIAFPEIIDEKEQFYSYHFQTGETLFKENNETIFNKLLSFLENNLWNKVDIEKSVLKDVCHNFYYKKSIERLELFNNKYPNHDQNKKINGQHLPSVESLFDSIDWSNIVNGEAYFMHGDLHFENILYNSELDTFKLLDWRQDFGGHIEFGDIYYDFAKMYKSIILNDDFIKLNLFSYSESENEITFDFAQRFSTKSYLRIFDEYITSKGFDLPKVKLLVGIAYLNMAPLHHHPFDKMLFSLSRYFIHDHISKN